MAIESLNFRTIAVYSMLTQGAVDQSKNYRSVSVLPCINYQTFPEETFRAMNACSVMVGNSSAGIVDLPALKSHLFA